MAYSDHRRRWRDHNGKLWPTVLPGKTLKFCFRHTQALRAFVYRRDNFTCQMCGAIASWVPWPWDGTDCLSAYTKELRFFHIDHKVPRCRNGSNHPRNLQMLCDHCNCGKDANERQNTHHQA